MLSNYYQNTFTLDYIQDATLYNCKLSYCFLEDLSIDNSSIGLLNPNNAKFTNVTLNSLFVTQGNIGIDVSNPSYKLDVNGDINFTGFLYKNGILYTGGGGGGAGGNGSTNVFITGNAESAGSQTILSGLNVLKFPDNQLTSGHIAYNSTTGSFSVSVEGLYSIFVDVDFYNADKSIDLYILKNGIEDSVNGRIGWVNCPGNDAVTINANVYLNIGDFITVNIFNNSINSFTTPYANNKVNSFAMALFNSSQWNGDKGFPISYTSASVTMLDAITTNLTVDNLLVSTGNISIGYLGDPSYKLDVNGNINITGDLYKNDVLYLPRPVYLTRSAQSKDSQTILSGINILEFPDSGYSTGDITYNSGKFTVNQDGLYSIYVDIDFYNADKNVDLYILKNGIEDSVNGRIAWVNCPGNDATSLNAIVYLQETDYIIVIVSNSSLNSFTTPYDINKVNSFAISLLNSSSSSRNSQWLGDIGNTITYTSGNVVINNSTFTTYGNLGIGVTSPNYQLELSLDSAAKPSTNTWTISSDSRLKTNVKLADLEICYNTVKNLPLKYYKWSEDFINCTNTKDYHKIGWIADDVEKFFPKSVGTIAAFGLDNCKSLNTDSIYSAMYGTIQYLINKIEILEEKLQK